MNRTLTGEGSRFTGSVYRLGAGPGDIFYLDKRRIKLFIFRCHWTHRF